MIQEKISCLGKEFDTEDARREWFRNELRSKLPELKKMEGFPIGEDEDILNLSDPPFYTACPNPWLNDFIAEWKEEKATVKGRTENIHVREPYAADVSEGKNNPIYNAHSYHTKVPHPAIMRYILHYTQPGDIVLDGFAGTGMTGVASKLCEFPDNELKFKIEEDFRRNGLAAPKWGRRNAIISDLSPIASFISNQYNKPIDLFNFETEISSLLEKLRKEYNWLYETNHTNGLKGTINYLLWSDVFLCSKCNNDIIFWENAIDHSIGEMLDEIICPNCNLIHTKKTLDKKWITDIDKSNGSTIRKIESVPVLISYKYNGKKFTKKPDDSDFELLKKISQTKNNFWYPVNALPKGDKMSDPKTKGITNVHHFYTDRSLIILSAYWDAILKTERAAFIFTAMQRIISKLASISISYYFHGGGGAINAGTKGTFYISSINPEVNVFNAIDSRKENMLFEIPNNYFTITNCSCASEINLLDNSVDYIFTDPPFGANIMYSELNFIWESWLKVKTCIKTEAIENKTQGKSTLDYQKIMLDCFSEYFRILVPGKWLTVEFSNTSAAVWNGIQTALQLSGFIIANVAALNKKQGSYNAYTSPTAVKQDLVISCYKPSIEFENKFNLNQQSDVAVWDFIVEHLQHLPIHLTLANSTSTIIERSLKILYDRLIAFYIQRDLSVPIDAVKFQQGMRERFIERDGMFFTNEQVQEYDTKKAAVPNFTQLSFFVANEQDSIYWLRNLLEKERKTESDLHPFWMKEVASNMRKGDALPEMRAILEENFLKDEQGKWYVPNPENEADLEKLRTRRLLKQFETYKTEATKAKAKIKECRVEALRAGFKQCYQDKDFKTIVTIGDKIPNNLLMEDEVLLQFYDIASSRV